jgi:UDP-GlcNAc:undecaprenyl-phosphate GlcNAc-1-phosphate transferase
MTTLLVILGCSCGLCLVLTPLVRGLAARYGLVDRPDGQRKLHARAVPTAGGLAILLSGAGALAAALLTFPSFRDRLDVPGPSLLGLLAAAVAICLVGVADDYWHLRAGHKLLGQLLAVGVVIHSGLVVRSLRLFDWEINLGYLAVPFTALWLLGAINSLNLVDGVDGLLSSLGLIISLALAVMAYLNHHWAAACVALALAGALLGFLRYNFPPATIFLGDSGSMLIGLVVGALAIEAALKAPATVALAAPTALLTIPFFDTAAAIVRRKLTGRSICATDREHLHHCLLRRGFSPRDVLFWVSCFCLTTVVGVLASLALKNELCAILSAAAVIAILVVSQLFGYAEFVLLKHQLLALAGSLLRGANGHARAGAAGLQNTPRWAEFWAALTASSPRLNLATARLRVHRPLPCAGQHARWQAGLSAREGADLWRAELPVVVGGQAWGRLEISGRRDGQPIALKIAAVADLIAQFEDRATELAAEGPPANGQPVWQPGVNSGPARG